MNKENAVQPEKGGCLSAHQPMAVYFPYYSAVRDRCKLLSAMRPQSHLDPIPAPDSRQLVRDFLAALGPNRAPKTPPLDKDVERLTRVVGSVVQAVDDEILTYEEADAVIQFVAGCFLHRRIDEVLNRVTKPKKGAWFMLHGSLTRDD